MKTYLEKIVYVIECETSYPMFQKIQSYFAAKPYGSRMAIRKSNYDDDIVGYYIDCFGGMTLDKNVIDDLDALFPIWEKEIRQEKKNEENKYLEDCRKFLHETRVAFDHSPNDIELRVYFMTIKRMYNKLNSLVLSNSADCSYLLGDLKDHLKAYKFLEVGQIKDAWNVIDGMCSAVGETIPLPLYHKLFDQNMNKGANP